MTIQRIALSAACAAVIAALPLSAEAQYYRPCPAFPLFWPLCAATAVVGTAAAVATAPFRALAAPYYYRPYYYRPYAYAPPPAYYAPGYYAAPYPYGRPY